MAISFWVIVSILLISIVIALWLAGPFPISSGRRIYHRYFSSVPKIYQKVVGYESDDMSRLAIEKALRKETEYQERYFRGEKLEAAAAGNALILGDLHHFREPAERADRTAEEFYEQAVQRITDAPETAIDGEISPEFILDRVATFRSPASQRVEFARQRVRGIRQSTVRPPVVNDDPQNVHDSNVNNTISEVYRRIRELAEPTVFSYRDEIVEKARNQQGLNQEQKKLAIKTIESMGPSDFYSIVNDNADSILQNVWRRTQAPENNANRELLETSFFQSLVDCHEANYLGEPKLVCLGGRCNRVLQSLVLLDADPVIATPAKTTDLLRQEILGRTSRILNTELNANPALAEAYSANDPVAEETLRNVIKTKLQDEYKSTTKPSTLDTVIRDALAGI